MIPTENPLCGKCISLERKNEMIDIVHAMNKIKPKTQQYILAQTQ